MSAIQGSQPVASYDFRHDDAVTLIVSPFQRNMMARANYLTRHSEYFKAALKKEWLEGETRTITLPESPDVMAHHIAFAYEIKLPTSDNPLKVKADFEYCYQLLANLFVFGERFLNQSLKKAVILEFFRIMSVKDGSGIWWYPGEGEVNTIYRGTPEHSLARRLMVDIHVTEGGKHWIHDGLEPAFLVDLAKAFYDKSKDYITHAHNQACILTPDDYF